MINKSLKKNYFFYIEYNILELRFSYFQEVCVATNVTKLTDTFFEIEGYQINDNGIEDLNEEILEETFEDDHSRAERRKNTYLKKKRQEDIKSFKKMSSENSETKLKSMCIEEKRLRKKVCVRKARYSKEQLNHADYKKTASLEG